MYHLELTPESYNLKESEFIPECRREAVLIKIGNINLFVFNQTRRNLLTKKYSNEPT